MTDPRLLSRTRDIAGAIRLLIVSDYWTEDRRAEFDRTCAGLFPGLAGVAPFNLFERYPAAIEAWSLWLPSTTGFPDPAATPGAGPVPAVVDPATGAFQVTTSAVPEVLSGSVLPRGDRGTSSAGQWSDRGRGVPVVVCFLLPPTTAAPVEWVSTEFVDLARTVPVWPPRYLACSADAGWPRIVARALGSAMGLGEEWSGDGSGSAEPATPQAAMLAAAQPNLVAGPAPPVPPTASFKWFDELDARARTSGVPGPKGPGPIRLVEGGGGYRSGVFRSAPDCLMRRRIAGDTATSVRSDPVEFCPLCRRLLTRSITGRSGTAKRVRLDGQRTEFEKASWDEITIHQGAPPPVVTAAALAGERAAWTFTARVGADVGGLRIEDLRLTGQDLPAVGGDPADPSLAEETVASRIDFRDLAVELDDGTRVGIDLARAFASTATSPVLRVGRRGRIGATGPVLQHGVSLTVVDDLGGTCPVEVTMSFVVRGEARDIEPAGGLVACKFFPQITLRWLRGGEHAVTRMRGCVRFVAANRVRAGHQHHGAAAGPSNVASMFCDTNSVADQIRRRRPPTVMAPVESRALLLLMLPLMYPGLPTSWVEDLEVPPSPLGFPLWAVIFDYHKPDIRSDIEIAAVRGPRSDRALRQVRSATVTWPPGSTHSVTTERDRDQGQYDNVHSHGSMGVDPFDPRAPKQPMVHAPGCAEACLHMHWRWGYLGPPGAAAPWVPQVHMAGFRGWSRSGADELSEQHETWGTPLIPPNQDLRVALTHPDTTRTDLWNDVVTADRALDPAAMTYWWTVDVTEPAREQAQVLFEAGVSFAYRYHFGAVMSLIQLAMVRLVAGRLLPADAGDAEVSHLLYSLSRWYLDAADAVVAEQIPQGTVADAGGRALEDL